MFVSNYYANKTGQVLRLYFVSFSMLLSFPISAQVCISSHHQFQEIHFLKSHVTPILRELSCVSHEILDSDKKIIQAINYELSSLPQISSKENYKDHKKKVSEIIKRYQTRLSSTALIIIIADAHKRRMDMLVSALKKDPEFSKAYLKFNSVIENYNKESNRLLCGIDCREKALAPLETVKNELFLKMRKTKIDSDVKYDLTKGIFAILQKTYQENSRRASISSHRASMGLLASGSVLSLDLMALSVLSGGATGGVATAVTTATGSSFAGVLTSTAVASVSGAAGGAAFMGSLGLTKMVGHSAVVKNPGMNFYCNLVEEIEKEGPQALQDALVGAEVGGVIGGGLGVLGGAAPVLAKVTATTVSIGLTGVGALGVIKEGSLSYEYLKKAKEAEDRGDEQDAILNTNKFKKALVDSGLDLAATGMGAISVKKISKTLKNSDGSSLSLKDFISSAWEKVKNKTSKASAAKVAPITLEIMPTKGPPVAIGILMETADGKQVLAIGQQVGNGHSGLLNTIRESTNGNPPKILWAGEVVLKNEGGKIKIEKANETAGIIVRSSEEMMIGYKPSVADAKVENLKAFLSRPENKNLKAKEFQMNKFSDKTVPEHYDPNAPAYSDFRHEMGNFGLRFKAEARRLTRDPTPKEHRAVLTELSKKMAESQTTLKHIENQRGTSMTAELDELKPLFKKIQREQELTQQEYDQVVGKLDKFYRTYKEPKQIFGP